MGLAEDRFTPLLSAVDGPPVEVENPRGAGELVLVCEHASLAIPRALGDLGLSAEARTSHIAWDPGALEVSRRLSAHFDAPLVAARFSRLVYDCNRPPERADATPARVDIYDAPGNRDLSAEARAARVHELYEPFSLALQDLLETRRLQQRPTALVTVHSFTPVYLGARREVELGLLHDADSRLVDAMLPRAEALTGLRTERNAPYGPEDGVTHTLKRHALPRGLPNVMIEARNDLIADEASQTRVADRLAALLREGLETPGLRTLGSRTLGSRTSGSRTPGSRG